MTDPSVRALMALARARAHIAASDRLNKDYQGQDHATGNAPAVKALADWFGSPDAVSASALPDYLVDDLVNLGIAREAAVKAGELALTVRLTGRSRHGSPDPYPGMPLTRRVAAQEPLMRARYVLAAAWRLSEAESDTDVDMTNALRQEHRWLGMHVDVGRRRRAAAARIDALAKSSGHQWMRWNTQGDSRVDSRCRALEGRVFTADDPPAIPGAVHSHCRCYATTWESPLFKVAE